MKRRASYVLQHLNKQQGFTWPYNPGGGLTVFPCVEQLYDKIPMHYQDVSLSKGAAVAEYLLQEKGVSVTPGSVYGKNGRNNIKLILCAAHDIFYNAIDRLAAISGE